MTLVGKKAVVTGGSRGLGLGIVEELVSRQASVWVVARDGGVLESVRARLGVKTISADITDPVSAKSILADIGPEILILNAGAIPSMERLDEMNWEDFSVTWNTDVKGALYWIQSALKLPMSPGGRVLLTSSGAAVNGSPMSGGYAGAKRMIWHMAQYANGLSKQKGLGIRFQAVVPMQMIGGTRVGDAGSNAYARARGVTPEAFLASFGAPMPPRLYGEHIANILVDPQYATAPALGVKGDSGITRLEERSA
jgi:NAD(P)-dependent dehydrogenase (short-subunit alcohol dehydrogenase family)